MRPTNDGPVPSQRAALLSTSKHISRGLVGAGTFPFDALLNVMIREADTLCIGIQQPLFFPGDLAVSKNREDQLVEGSAGLSGITRHGNFDLLNLGMLEDLIELI